MKNLLIATIILLTPFNALAQSQKPADTLTASFNDVEITATAAEAMVFKVVHHANYLLDTIKAAGGTNKLMTTRVLPTDGKDLVVTPALDHLYSRAVLDLSNGPVVMTLPKVPKDHYFSIMVTDQEHYVTYDEIRPSGNYVFVRHDYKGKIPKADVLITDRGNHPHIFLRTQVKTIDEAGYSYTHAIQDKVTLSGKVTEVNFTDPLSWTLKTHDVYEQNSEFLQPLVGKYTAEDQKRMFKFMNTLFAQVSASKGVDSVGKFGPIDSPEEGANDAFNRLLGIVGHLALPIMSAPDHDFAHTFHYATTVNCNGQALTGEKTEVFTFPYNAPVSEFWSVTRYDGTTYNTIEGKNDIYNAYNTKPDENGNITITFSVENPKDGTYWMPVNKGPYYFAERNYGPDLDKISSALQRCKSSK
jgi:hypothetical protein